MSDAAPLPDDEIRIGISSCLLGEEVRFDGGHKRDRFIVGTLTNWFRFVPLCPEMEIGLGTPRESMRLVKTGAGEPRLVAPKSGSDHTDAMNEWSRAQMGRLCELELCGFILKRASPSCGMERVREYDANGVPTRTGTGLFARVLMDSMPLLPVEEEGRLHDPGLRENFVERVFGYRRVTALFAGEWSLGHLVKFHEGEKYLLLSHDPEAYRELGRLVAGAKGKDRRELAKEYAFSYMAALAVHATPGKHFNVLQHMVGYFRDSLDAAARREVHAVLEDYRRGIVPLVVPVTLVAHWVKLLDIGYLRGQKYLEPHPRELMIRNHV